MDVVENVLYAVTIPQSKETSKNMVIFRDCGLCRPAVLPGILVVLGTGPRDRAWELESSAYPIHHHLKIFDDKILMHAF